jgi:hypothetical protein
MNTFDANRSYPKNRSGWSGIREAAIALPFANDVAVPFEMADIGRNFSEAKLQRSVMCLAIFSTSGLILTASNRRGNQLLRVPTFSSSA